MYFKQMPRFIHTTRLILAAEKSALATLRKKTGYTFSNCKKALEMHNNDLPKAEKWLKDQAQAMGWTKATKLEGRNTSQGLVGLLVKNNIGAMVEVNCETDFVARNESFASFVKAASAACVKYADAYEHDQNIQKIGLNTESLRQIKLDDGKTLGDHLALLIGTVGENASLNRAICFKAPESIVLTGYTHPAPATEPEPNEPVVGKYASIVAFKNNGGNGDILKKISQHIVGMKPVKIGDKNVDKPCEDKDDETCLIFQEYVLDNDYTVGEIMEENNVEIVDYQRFECGEKNEP